jgi:benzoyl-CoA 2,3-dioxygenase component A
MTTEAVLIQQHLIDPEICIRCNTCEATCRVGAITHDSRNYVVDADKCNLCMACVPPCPTGSIDNWRSMPKVKVYSVEEQLTWDDLPAALSEAELQAMGISGGLGKMFSSHPPLEERIAALQANSNVSHQRDSPSAWAIAFFFTRGLGTWPLGKSNHTRTSSSKHSPCI